MGQGYFPGSGGDLAEDPFHLPLEGRFMGGLLFSAERCGGQRFAVGEWGKVDRTVGIFQYHRMGIRIHRAGDVELPGGKQRLAEVQPVRVVMVAGYEDDGNLQIQHQAAEGLVQQVHSFRGRNGPVVDVPSHQESIHFAVPGQVQDLVQSGPLVFQQVETMEDPAQVPVRCM